MPQLSFIFYGITVCWSVIKVLLVLCIFEISNIIIFGRTFRNWFFTKKKNINNISIFFFEKFTIYLKCFFYKSKNSLYNYLFDLYNFIKFLLLNMNIINNYYMKLVLYYFKHLNYIVLTKYHNSGLMRSVSIFFLLDVPFNGQLFFQDPATPIMEGIILFHHELLMLQIFIAIFVLWILVRTVMLFSLDNCKLNNFLIKRLGIDTFEVDSYNVLDTKIKPFSSFFHKYYFYLACYFIKNKSSVRTESFLDDLKYNVFNNFSTFIKYQFILGHLLYLVKYQIFTFFDFTSSKKDLLKDTSKLRAFWRLYYILLRIRHVNAINFYQDIQQFFYHYNKYYRYTGLNKIENFDKRLLGYNGKVPSKVTHNTLLEIVWTVIPSLILIVIAIPSFALLYAMDELVAPALTIHITGNQWYWRYSYTVFREKDFSWLSFFENKGKYVPRQICWDNNFNIEKWSNIFNENLTFLIYNILNKKDEKFYFGSTLSDSMCHLINFSFFFKNDLENKDLGLKFIFYFDFLPKLIGDINELSSIYFEFYQEEFNSLIDILGTSLIADNLVKELFNLETNGKSNSGLIEFKDSIFCQNLINFEINNYLYFKYIFDINLKKENIFSDDMLNLLYKEFYLISSGEMIKKKFELSVINSSVANAIAEKLYTRKNSLEYSEVYKNLSKLFNDSNTTSSLKYTSNQLQDFYPLSLSIDSNNLNLRNFLISNLENCILVNNSKNIAYTYKDLFHYQDSMASWNFGNLLKNTTKILSHFIYSDSNNIFLGLKNTFYNNSDYFDKEIYFQKLIKSEKKNLIKFLNNNKALIVNKYSFLNLKNYFEDKLPNPFFYIYFPSLFNNDDLDKIFNLGTENKIPDFMYKNTMGEQNFFEIIHKYYTYFLFTDANKTFNGSLKDSFIRENLGIDEITNKIIPFQGQLDLRSIFYFKNEKDSSFYYNLLWNNVNYDPFYFFINSVNNSVQFIKVNFLIEKIEIIKENFKEAPYFKKLTPDYLDKLHDEIPSFKLFIDDRMTFEEMSLEYEKHSNFFHCSNGIDNVFLKLREAFLPIFLTKSCYISEYDWFIFRLRYMYYWLNHAENIDFLYRYFLNKMAESGLKIPCESYKVSYLKKCLFPQVYRTENGKNWISFFQNYIFNLLMDDDKGNCFFCLYSKLFSLNNNLYMSKNLNNFFESRYVFFRKFVNYLFLNISDFQKLIRKKGRISFESRLLGTENIDYYALPKTLGLYRLLDVDNILILPEKISIRLLITSSDVLHSWAVPSLGIKLDACPGRLNQASLYLNRIGTFYGQCSEICGINHAFMPIVVKSIPFSTYMYIKLICFEKFISSFLKF